MFWYVVVLLVLFLFMMINEIAIENSYNVELLMLRSSEIFLGIFMSCRSYLIGADTREYYAAYQQIGNTNINDLKNTPIFGFDGNYVLNLEIGYKLFNKLLSYLSKSPQLVIIATSILIILLLFYLIRKYSPYPLLSVWLYFTMGLFQTQMNISRNSIAILISYCAVVFLFKKEFIKYCLVIFLASLFHSSVLIFIPIYFVVNYIKISKNNLWSYLLTMLIMGIILAFMKKIVIPFLPSKYAYLAMNNSIKVEGVLIGVIYLTLFFLIYIFIKKYGRFDFTAQNNYGNWMFLLSMLCYGSGIGLSFATRIAILFGTYMVIYFPRIIQKSKMPLNRQRELMFLIIMLSGVEYLVRIHLNNIGKTIPFLFFWN